MKVEFDACQYRSSCSDIYNPAIVSGSSFRIIREHSNISLFTILKLTLSDVKYVPIAKRKRFI
jgi:hypothetical protein